MGKPDAVVSAASDLHMEEAALKRRLAVGVAMKMGLVDEEFRRGLPAVGSALSFGENRRIYGEGCEANLFFKVVSGVVRTCTYLSDGRRQIDAFYVPGNVFGIELSAEHCLSAETVCDSTLISYRRRDLEVLAASSEGFSQELFSYAMQSLARAQRHAFLLGRRCAIEKLAAFLTDWAAYSPGNNVLALEMPRQDIADYLGLTIETISRTFSHLESKALIELPSVRQVRLVNFEGLCDLNS